MKTRSPVAVLVAATLAAPACALAHGGHQAASAFHWHATDTFGLLLVAGSAALGWWLSRGGD